MVVARKDAPAEAGQAFNVFKIGKRGDVVRAAVFVVGVVAAAYRCAGAGWERGYAVNLAV